MQKHQSRNSEIHRRGQKWRAVMLGNRAAAHGNKLEVRDEERPDQIRRLLANDAFGEIGHDDSAVVHGESEIELWRYLPNDGAHVWTRRELPSFVENWSDRLDKLVLPKPARYRIVD